MFAIIDNTTSSMPADKLAIKLKSFVCSNCGEMFVFEMNDKQDKDFSNCSEHWHITKLFNIAKQHEYHSVADRLK